MSYPQAETDLISHLPSASVHGNLGSAHSSGYSSLDSEQNRPTYESDESARITLAPGQTLNGTGLSIKNLKELVTITPNGGIFDFDSLSESLNQAQKLQPSLLSVTLEAQDITRWRMAWQAVEKYDRLDGHVCRRSKDMPDIFEQKRLIFGFSITAVVYGGLHALAWFADFSSSTEQLLWRISAAIVMGGFPAAMGVFVVVGLFYNTRDDWDTYLALTLSILILLAYILARAYLVVECFINLSHLPAGVYDVPQWSSYFPHIA